MATVPGDIGRTIQRPEPTRAMMGGAIPANRLNSKRRSLRRGNAGVRRDRHTRRLLEAAGFLGGFQVYVMRDHDFIATSEFRRTSMANSTTIPRESISADSTAARSRSVGIHRLTSSTKPSKGPLAVSITPSPRTFWTEAPAAAALAADLSGLEGVVHSLLLSALEKIVDRTDAASQRSDDQTRRPLAIAETDSSIESSVRSPAEPRETMLRVGSLELDLINRSAKRGDRPIDLLPSEFRLLKYMMQRDGQLLTRAKLFQDVWHYKFLPETNLVDVHMGRLRRKVNGPNEAPMIRTVRGAGFILSATP